MIKLKNQRLKAFGERSLVRPQRHEDGGFFKRGALNAEHVDSRIVSRHNPPSFKTVIILFQGD